MFKGMKLEWGDFYQTIQDSVDGTALPSTQRRLLRRSWRLRRRGRLRTWRSPTAASEQPQRSSTFGTDLVDLGKGCRQRQARSEQVAQFTDRGINAISVLSTYLSKSSDEVSAMVTAGKIDFQGRSPTPCTRSGDSAKAANESFTGLHGEHEGGALEDRPGPMTSPGGLRHPRVQLHPRCPQPRAARPLKLLSTAFGAPRASPTMPRATFHAYRRGAVEKLCTFLGTGWPRRSRA